MQGSLEGGVVPPPGTFLPTGSHTYVVSFSNCPVNYWGNEAFELHGVASAAYNTADWSTLTAMLSADSLRGQEIGGFSGLNDVTADGSAVWTRVGSSTTTTTYTPATGARLVNNSTTNVATFGGGSYRVTQPKPDRWERDLTISRSPLTAPSTHLTGASNFTVGRSGSLSSAGETRIINNGTLVARIYGDAQSSDDRGPGAASHLLADASTRRIVHGRHAAHHAVRYSALPLPPDFWHVKLRATGRIAAPPLSGDSDQPRYTA